MKIFAKKKFNNQDEYYNRLPLASQVQRLGDYLTGRTKRKKPQFEGIYDVVEPVNQYNIYITILYQIDPKVRKAMKQYPEELHGIEENVYEMNICIGITHYNGKYIRVNVIQLDEYEQTLGFLRLDKMDLMSLPACKEKIREFIKQSIEKRYEGYEVMI